jgi:hypothetical protein
MPYLNVDDNFPEHPKVDALSDAAFRLHVAGMCYCAKQKTDGRLTPDRPARLVARFRTAALRELIGAGLWHDQGQGCGTDHCPTGDPGEYVIHDYLQWNKPRTWWDEKRAKDAKRQQEWRDEQERRRGESQG